MDVSCQFPQDLQESERPDDPVLSWHLRACPTCRDEMLRLPE